MCGPHLNPGESRCTDWKNESQERRGSIGLRFLELILRARGVRGKGQGDLG